MANILIPYVIAFAITLISAIWAIVIWSRVEDRFTPLLIYFVLSAICEIPGNINFLILDKGPSTLIYNLFVLIEAFLWLWLFFKWKLFRNNTYLFYTLASSFVAVYIADFIITGDMNTIFTAYRLYYGFVLVLLSIHHVNYQIVHETKNLIKSSSFLICIGLIIMFTNKILLETFYLVFSEYSFGILVIVTLIFKSILMLALLWMPTKPKGLHSL